MANRDDFLKLVNVIPASIEKDGKFTKHNTGVYFQNIPKFPLEGYSTIDHKQAEQDGWFKLDVLNNHVYKEIENENRAGHQLTGAICFLSDFNLILGSKLLKIHCTKSLLTPYF